MREKSFHAEATRNFATLSDLSIEIMDPKKTFETMIGDVIDTFRDTTPAVNQEFVRKNQIETNTCHKVSYSKNIMSFQVTPFCWAVFKKFA